MTRVWAIKQKSTGFFIPRFPKNQSKGGTWLEPTDKQPPRLFSTQLHAQTALGHWLKGHLKRVWRSPSPPDFVDEGDYDDVYDPVANRNPEDMEVVELELVEVLP